MMAMCGCPHRFGTSIEHCELDAGHQVDHSGGGYSWARTSTGRAECGCPRTYTGATIHRIACKVRIGAPRVFPPTPVEVAQARQDIRGAFHQIWTRAGEEYDRAIERSLGVGVHTEQAEIDQFIEWAKQRLHVIALARAVLPSDDGKANPTNDGT